MLKKEYCQRLRTRPARPDLGDLIFRKKEIFKLHLKLAERISSKPWKMKDLERALANLKTKIPGTMKDILMKYLRREL